jgi:hypothetical protein
MQHTFAWIFGGGGTITFGNSAMVDDIYPEWWGAVGDGVTDDYNALNMTFASSANARGVHFRSAVYGTASEILLPSMNDIEISGHGGPGGWNGQATIKWIGGADGTKAVIRAKASAAVGFGMARMRGLAVDANRLAGYAMVIEGSVGATYHNDWAFDTCNFRGGTKIGCLVGSINGATDVDSYPLAFNHCRFDWSNVNLFVNAQNAYGVEVNHCSFFASIVSGAVASETFTHIRGIKSGDLRINKCFFALMHPSAAAVDPETAAAIVWNAATPETSVIFSIRVDYRATISDCHSEEPRWLKCALAPNEMSGCEMSGCSTNYDSHVDTSPPGSVRNIDWDDFHKNTNTFGQGVGVRGSYSVVNNGGILTIRNCQFGNTYVNHYRKMYNNGRLTLDVPEYGLFLGDYGEVVHGANSLVNKVNGVTGGGLMAQSNWDLSAWMDANTLCDYIDKFNGAAGVSTITRSAANLLWGKNTVDMNVTNAAGSFTNGLIYYFRLPFAKKGTLFFAGYSATDPSAMRAYASANVTPDLGGGNTNFVWNPATGRYIASVPFTVDELNAAEQNYFIIGPELTFLGHFFYDAVFIVPGSMDLATMSALTWHGAARPMTSLQREHSVLGAAPTVGLWFKGDRAWNRNVAAGGVPGWICTTGDGTGVGTWKAMAVVAA